MICNTCIVYCFVSHCFFFFDFLAHFSPVRMSGEGSATNVGVDFDEAGIMSDEQDEVAGVADPSKG